MESTLAPTEPPTCEPTTEAPTESPTEVEILETYTPDPAAAYRLGWNGLGAVVLFVFVVAVACFRIRTGRWCACRRAKAPRYVHTEDEDVEFQAQIDPLTAPEVEVPKTGKKWQKL